MSRVKKTYIYWGIAFFFAFLIQTTILKYIAVFGLSPNLILCMVAVCSFLYEEKIGLIYGIIFGILLDFVSSLYIGPSAIAFVLIYLFATIIKDHFNRDRFLPALLLAGVSTPLYLLVTWLLYFISDNPVAIIVILKALPVLLIYNGIIIILLHMLIVKHMKKNARRSSFKRNINFRGKYRT